MELFLEKKKERKNYPVTCEVQFPHQEIDHYQYFKLHVYTAITFFFFFNATQNTNTIIIKIQFLLSYKIVNI